jgi:hypothetical protein
MECITQLPGVSCATSIVVSIDADYSSESCSSQKLQQPMAVPSLTKRWTDPEQGFPTFVAISAKSRAEILAPMAPAPLESLPSSSAEAFNSED